MLNSMNDPAMGEERMDGCLGKAVREDTAPVRLCCSIIQCWIKVNQQRQLNRASVERTSTSVTHNHPNKEALHNSDPPSITTLDRQREREREGELFQLT